MDLWHPRAMRVQPAAASGSAYAAGYPWRQIVHTTEGGPNYTPSPTSYFGHQSWPTATAGRIGGVARIAQHFPLNVAARAVQNDAGGVETNRARAVQLEICWWAARIAELPDDIAGVVADWILWVAAQTGAPLTGPAFYGPAAGWTLATETARQRMTPAAWRAFTGICGHQHVPENDHWDPGALDLGALLGTPILAPDPDPAPVLIDLEDDMPATLTPSWAKRTANGRLPFFRLEFVDADTARVFASPGAPLAPGLEKIPAPKFTYGSATGDLSVLTIDRLGSPAVGLGESPDGSVDLLCANGATFLVARRP